jgi:hypothetical protein
MLSRTLWGEPIQLPGALLAEAPELAAARFRHGGLPLRLGGWLMGGRDVAGLALWNTVWLAGREAVDDLPLLLHEIRHVQQFAVVPFFPWRYLWQSLRHGYHRNRFEVDARDYAARRIASLNGGVRG